MALTRIKQWMVDGLQAALDLKFDKSSAGILSAHRNKIINGDFRVAMRAGGATLASNTTAWVADRWRVYNATDKTLVVSWGRAAPYGRSGYRLAFTFDVAPTVGSVQLYQCIEDVDTLSNGDCTASIDMIDAGLLAGSQMLFRPTQHFGAGGSADVVPAAVPLGVVSGQVHKFLSPLPSVAGKTIGAGNYLHANFSFTPRAAGYFVLSGISLVEGDATGEDNPFAARHVAEEQQLCLRYYEMGRTTLMVQGLGSFTYLAERVDFRAKKRAIPTVIRTGTGGYTGSTEGSFPDVASTDGFYFSRTNGTAAGGDWTADAEF